MIGGHRLESWQAIYVLIVLDLFKILESKIDHNFHSLIPKEDLKPSIATSMLQTEQKTRI